MRMIANIAGVSVLLLLGACSSAPPKISPQELTAKRLSTLNIYDDNRFGLKSYRLNDKNNASWIWSKDKDRVLGLMIDNNIFNVRDLQSVTSRPLASAAGKTSEISVVLKSGEKRTAAAGYGWIQEERKNGYFGPAWVLCDRNKNCGAARVISDVGSYNDLGKLLTSVSERDLAQEISVRNTDRFAGIYADVRISNDSSVVPTLDGLSEVLVLSDDQRDGIEQRIREVNQKRKAFVAEREREAQEKEAAIIREAEQMRKGAKVGTRTNCGQIYQMNLPMVGVQTMLGMQQIELARLFGPSAGCRFNNGVYIGR